MEKLRENYRKKKLKEYRCSLYYIHFDLTNFVSHKLQKEMHTK